MTAHTYCSQPRPDPARRLSPVSPEAYHVPDVVSVPAQAMLESVLWRKLSWRRGVKGRLAARFAAIRVRVADGPPQRIGTMGAQHLPGEEVWLVGEHRSSGERKYYLSNLPPDLPLKRLAGVVKARWVCEQAHQQMKEELGLALRRPIMARPSPARADEHDRLAVPAVSPPHRGEAGKKESDAGRRRDHRNRACRPSGPRSSRPLRSHPQPHAHTAVTRFALLICQSSASIVFPASPASDSAIAVAAPIRTVRSRHGPARPLGLPVPRVVAVRPQRQNLCRLAT